MTYEQLMYIGIGMGVIFLTISVVVFFGLGVADAIGELTGLKKKAAIRGENNNSRSKSRKVGSAGLMKMLTQGTDKLGRNDETERTDETDRTERTGKDSEEETEHITDYKKKKDNTSFSSEVVPNGRTDGKGKVSFEDDKTEKLSDAGEVKAVRDTQVQSGVFDAETTFLKPPTDGGSEQHSERDFEIVTRCIIVHTDEEIM